MTTELADFTVIDYPRENRSGAVAERLAAHRDRLGYETTRLDPDEFERYLAFTDYRSQFPKYYKEFGPPRHSETVFRRKCLEHFWSFKLACVRPQALVMDVASSNSPVPQLIPQLFAGARCFRQDLSYRTDWERGVIGGDAARIDVPDASFDVLLLHNSWEHFEGEADRQALCEAARILRPNGMIVVVPVFLAEQAHQITSPAVWDTKYPGLKGRPAMDPAIPVVVDDGIKQRLSKHPDPETLVTLTDDIAEMDFRVVHMLNAAEMGFPPFALVGMKRLTGPIAPSPVDGAAAPANAAQA